MNFVTIFKPIYKNTFPYLLSWYAADPLASRCLSSSTSWASSAPSASFCHSFLRSWGARGTFSSSCGRSIAFSFGVYVEGRGGGGEWGGCGAEWGDGVWSRCGRWDEMITDEMWFGDGGKKENGERRWEGERRREKITGKLLLNKYFFLCYTTKQTASYTHFTNRRRWDLQSEICK